MRAILLIVGFLMVVALTALFAGPVLVDWNAYRGTFEKQASALLGREVRVGGNASLRLLPSPYLHFDNVRIADQTGRFDSPLIRVDGFTIWLSVPPLLRGAIEAREIELDGPVIRLSVDESGSANWHGLAAGHVALPFMPTEVSLASVKIRNGRLSVARADSSPLVAVAAIDGELSAAKLEGPYRFKGSLTYAGAKRDVRVSTAALGAGHSLKVKAVVRVPETSSAYTFDGDLLALDALPRLSGALEVQFGVDAAKLAADPEAETSTARPALAAGMRLTGQLDADLSAGALTNLSITFDSDGRPQLVTGEIAFEWKRKPAIGARLAARWLDLDRIAGQAADKGPWPALESYIGRFLSAFASDAETRLVARIDQATLGGELIGDISIDAKRAPAGIEILGLSARLPGATTLDINGMVAESDGAHRFTGPVQLSGTSLGKMLKWAMPQLALAGPPSAGFYMLRADADASLQSVSLDRLLLEIDQSRIAGSARYTGGDANSLTLVLDGDRLDLSEIITEVPNLPALVAGLGSGGEPAPLPAEGQSLVAAATRLLASVDADVTLRIGDLVTAVGRLENLKLKLRRAAGRVDLDELAFKSGAALRLQASGSLAGDASDTEGLVRLRVEAPTAAAVATLDQLLALPEAVRGPALRYAVRAPLRLAGSLRRDKGSGMGRSEIVLDGSSAGERLTLMLRSDHPFADLASGQNDLTVTITDTDGSRLLSRLAGRPDAPVLVEAEGLEQLVPGELSLRASGVPSGKMTAALRIAAAGVSLSFQGDAHLTGADKRIDGRLAVASASADTLLEAAGLPAAGDRASAVRFDTWIVAGAQRAELQALEGEIDGATVTGKASVDYSSQTPEIDLTLKAKRARLAALLTPLVAAVDVGPDDALLADAPEAQADATVPAGGADEAIDTEANVWSDLPFDLGPLEGWRGHLHLEAEALDVLDGLALEDATLTAGSTPAGLTLTGLDGNALGGAVRVTGRLMREKAGASLVLEASVTGAELEDMFVDETGRSKAKGAAKARLALKSSGLTPRGMVAVLEGDGELAIAGGQINGLSPVTVDQAARQLLTHEGKITQELIAQTIGESRLVADFPTGSFATRLSVIDGTLRAEQVAIDAPQSIVRLKGRVDLQSFHIDSDWTLTPKPAEPLQVPLPPVTIVYSGPLAELRTLAAEADVEALERELLARRIIGGEEQLEGLWPDAVTREEGTVLVPDADRIAPIPAQEASAALPEAEPPGTLPQAGQSADNPKDATVKVKPAAEPQAAIAAPSTENIVKPKRKAKRKRLNIRESDNAGMR